MKLNTSHIYKCKYKYLPSKYGQKDRMSQNFQTFPYEFSFLRLMKEFNTFPELVRVRYPRPRTRGFSRRILDGDASLNELRH